MISYKSCKWSRTFSGGFFPFLPLSTRNKSNPKIQVTQNEESQGFPFSHNSEISSDAVGLHSHRRGKNFVLYECSSAIFSRSSEEAAPNTSSTVPTAITDILLCFHHYYKHSCSRCTKDIEVFNKKVSLFYRHYASHNCSEEHNLFILKPIYTDSLHSSIPWQHFFWRAGRQLKQYHKIPPCWCSKSTLW